MYFVNGRGRNLERGYKAYDQFHGGWMRMPDLRVFSGSPPIGAVNFKVGIGVAGQILIDRYGYIRISGGPGIGAGVMIGAFLDGWVTKNRDGSRILSEDDLGNAIEGWSFNGSGTAFISRGVSDSSSDSAYQVWWQGVGLGLAVDLCSASYTFEPYDYKPELSWDWVDTSRKYSSQDISR